LDELSKCVHCGALNRDSGLNCGVCGGNLTSSQRVSQESVVTSRMIHAKGLVGLVVGLVILTSGFLLLDSPAAPLGLFLLFIGVASVGAVIGTFKGLPYQPNLGWHRSGDPDLAATGSRGARPVNTQMLEVDRELENKKREEESD
jgi:hypothetical protein